MKKAALLIILFCSLALTSCKRPIDAQLLTGRWNYVKVENPYSPNPPDTVLKDTIAANKPYIKLDADGVLTMVWGGKVLSHGTYKVDGVNIRYTEALAGGKTRTFPFWIKELTSKEIIFETKDDDPVRVTATKE